MSPHVKRPPSELERPALFMARTMTAYTLLLGGAVVIIVAFAFVRPWMIASLVGAGTLALGAGFVALNVPWVGKGHRTTLRGLAPSAVVALVTYFAAAFAAFPALYGLRRPETYEVPGLMVATRIVAVLLVVVAVVLRARGRKAPAVSTDGGTEVDLKESAPAPA